MKRKLLHLLNALGGGSYSLLFGGLGIIALVCIARAFGLMETVELKTLDLFLRWRPAEATDTHITILEITEEDIQSLGVYPIPDSLLADVLTELKTYEPTTIGLDLFRDLPIANSDATNPEAIQLGHQRLIGLIQDSPEIVVIESILGEPISLLPDIPEEQVGFVDVLIDEDGFYRTSLLASPAAFDDRYHLSLTLQLAAKYLEPKGFELSNGIQDPNTVRFGDTELFRLRPDSGGYVSEEYGGNPVILVNFRSGKAPFDKISLSQFIAKDFSEDLIRDRIVLLGITAVSTKDYINSAAVHSSSPALVPGVEFQAHAISQIVNAVLNDRPILRTFPNELEYLGIIVIGLLGISLIHVRKNLFFAVPIFLLLSFLLIALGHSLIFVGLWIPIFPMWLVFCLNGSSALLYRTYQNEQAAKDQLYKKEIQLYERQRIIRQSYDTIHNGPLQTIKSLIRRSVSGEDFSSASLESELMTLDDELRQIYEFMQKEYLTLESQTYLAQNCILDLSEPLHNLLYQVYHNTLSESADYFSGIKLKLPDFTPMATSRLTLEDKEAVIRCLEEALCNVRQHAVGVTRLTVVCKQQGQHNIVQVKDNGKGVDADLVRALRKGQGTKQAKALASRLGGQFQRQAVPSGGMVSTLMWPVKAPARWKLWLQRFQ